jgi:antitoxin component of RelBE/YafQ-DinJ toxin-antitoxin module
MTIASRISARRLTRRGFSLAGVLVLALATAGCGDSEADQRKAFIGFLQDINHRSGVHFLRPKPEEEKAFGDYLRHYTIITDFNKDLTAVSNDYYERLKKLGIGPNSQARTIEQMVARRQEIPVVKEETTKYVQAIETRVAKVNAERAALQQPDDLKAVYNTTFDKLINAPAQAMVNSNKALLALTDSSMRLVDYINDHRGKLTVSGTQVRANDARTLAEVDVLLKAHQENGRRFQDAQRNGQRVLGGS